ncbi:hypothetical protein [Iamia sp.]|uniref:hypothetical protein n=1 Tax=Iamia sp. TaxID=2722710 RepID=UPI002CF15C09|nr:hypothetical protein [Iamia sp.]HXH58757.1 hypothetical protein [Iamia sp.]
MALVVDDHLLLDLLTEDVRGWLAEAVSEAAVYTTASWYYRVANASEHGSGQGSLSGRIAAVAEPARTALRARIARLPDEIGLVGPLTLVPVMARLDTQRRLNYLSAEALALALLTDATAAVRTDSPPLRNACDALQVEYRVVDAP